MNSERENAYLNLIKQVVACPNGQEPEILSANSDLIDAGFVQMLLQVSSSMAHDGDPDVANFLANLARLLAKSLGLTPDLTPIGVEG